MRRVLGWIAAGSLLLWALVAFAAPTQNTPVEADRFKAGVELIDQTPLGMISLAGDQHRCDKWPFTEAYPLTQQHKIPFTVHLSRGNDRNCNDSPSTELTNSDLATIAQSKYMEISVHGMNQKESLATPITAARGHGSLTSGISLGTLLVGSTVRGQGTDFQAGDVGKPIYIPRASSTPFLITAVTNIATITLSPAPAIFPVGANYVMITDAASGSDMATTINSAVVTSASSLFTQVDTVQPPVSGGLTGKGSMVIIQDAPENPYYVLSVDSNTQLTLNKNVTATSSGKRFAVFCWFECANDQLKNAIDAIAADSGLPVESITTWASPSNRWNPLSAMQLQQYNLDAMVVAFGTREFNTLSDLDSGILRRNLTSLHAGNPITIEGFKQFARIAAESKAWWIINTEVMSPPAYETGTSSGTAGTAAITGTGTLWQTASSLAACRAAPTTCFMQWKTETNTQEHKIASFNSESSITLTTNLKRNVSGTYFIGNSDTSSGQIGSARMIDWFMEWLNQNRHLVRAVTVKDGVRYMREHHTRVGRNELVNPRMRIVREDYLPPDNTSPTGTLLPIAGWTWGGTVAATTSVASLDGFLSITDTAATYNVTMEQVIPSPSPSEPYYMTTGFDPINATIVNSGTGALILGNTQMYEGEEGSDNAAVVAGGSLIIGMEYLQPRPPYYRVGFDCSSGACGAATLVIGPTPTASLAPFSITRNGAGDYRISVAGGVGNSVIPAVISSRTNNTMCKVTGLSSRLIDIICVNDAGVTTDTSFIVFIFDNAVQRMPRPITYRARLDGRGTLRMFAPYLGLGWPPRN